MKNWILAATTAMLSVAAQAAGALPNGVGEYEDLLDRGALSCKLDQDLFDTAVRLHGTADPQTRDDLANCKRAFGERARADFPSALQAANSEAMKTAVRNLYATWQAYLGKPDLQGEERFERARSALDADRMVSK